MGKDQQECWSLFFCMISVCLSGRHPPVGGGANVSYTTYLIHTGTQGSQRLYCLCVQSLREKNKMNHRGMKAYRKPCMPVCLYG
jgi:hypothetical protein